MSGQIFTVPVCSDHVPTASQSANFQCPAGQSAYFVSAYLSASDSYAESIDISSASTFFGFGFGIVIFFWVLGLKSSLLLKPFWR